MSVIQCRTCDDPLNLLIYFVFPNCIYFISPATSHLRFSEPFFKRISQRHSVGRKQQCNKAEYSWFQLFTKITKVISFLSSLRIAQFSYFQPIQLKGHLHIHPHHPLFTFRAYLTELYQKSNNSSLYILLLIPVLLQQLQGLGPVTPSVRCLLASSFSSSSSSFFKDL